jgi:hypothetical protein
MERRSAMSFRGGPTRAYGATRPEIRWHDVQPKRWIAALPADPSPRDRDDRAVLVAERGG